MTSIKKTVAFLCLPILAFCYLSSCSKTPAEPIVAPVGSCSGAPGPLFMAVKNLVQAKCQSCHSNIIQLGGKNFDIDCNIVSSGTRIKVRAVDDGTMPAGGPPLNGSEKAIIINWLAAGGNISD